MAGAAGDASQSHKVGALARPDVMPTPSAGHELLRHEVEGNCLTTTIRFLYMSSPRAKRLSASGKPRRSTTWKKTPQPLGRRYPRVRSPRQRTPTNGKLRTR